MLTDWLTAHTISGHDPPPITYSEPTRPTHESNT